MQVLFYMFKGRFLSKRFFSILHARLDSGDWAGKLVESEGCFWQSSAGVHTPLLSCWTPVWERRSLNAPEVCKHFANWNSLEQVRGVIWGRPNTGTRDMSSLPFCCRLIFTIHYVFWDTCKQCVELIKHLQIDKVKTKVWMCCIVSSHAISTCWGFNILSRIAQNMLY